MTEPHDTPEQSREAEDRVFKRALRDAVLRHAEEIANQDSGDTGCDTHAPVQAREVEVVRAALEEHRELPWPHANMIVLQCRCGWSWDTMPSGHSAHVAANILAALEPIRAAERQEAAREALLAAAQNTIEHNAWDNLTFADKAKVILSRGDVQRFTPAQIANWLRDRADGVAGRRET